MRVGIYVDAFNVYYGGRSLVRKAGTTRGWKWLDLGALARDLIDPGLWPNAQIASIAYCSAPRSQTGDNRGSRDQRAYFAVLEEAARLGGYGATIELGRYVHTEKSGLLLDARGGELVPWSTVGAQRLIPPWLSLRPKRHVDGADYALGDFKTFEEKGSDVNVATHLLVDVLSGNVDAAMIFSNDSDLALPIARARVLVPVGLVNPSIRPTAFHVKANRSAGVGRHWWRRLEMADLTGHQFPNPCGEVSKPLDW